MKRWTTVGLALLLLGSAAVAVPAARRGDRSVRLLFDDAEQQRGANFDPMQSAALFVGVRNFNSSAIEDVPYAVDDAVDLAYAFTLAPHVHLVPAKRVVLALSGSPVKPESKARLRALVAAGAQRHRAETSDIVALLRKQSSLAGREGMLIVSLATHGYLRDGTPWVLGASSLLRRPETTLSVPKLFEIIAEWGVQRSLIFIDACRERLEHNTRQASPRTITAAPFLNRIGRARGQAVFYAAAAGEVAYDNDEARNGEFTHEVIQGLQQCHARKDRGAVTAQHLATFVERRVHDWIRTNRDPDIGSATQACIDGDAFNMPLAQCWCDRCPPAGPARAVVQGSGVNAFDEHGAVAWHYDAGMAVAQSEVADLDADGEREVVYATRDAIGALDAGGRPLWRVHDALPLRTFFVHDVFREHTRNVVALWGTSRSSCIAIYSPDGTRVSSLDDDQYIDHVVVGCPTKRHKPKIVVTSANTLRVFDPKKLAAGKPVWSGRISPRSETIRRVEVVDYDGDGRSDIRLTTLHGVAVVVDFAGKVLRTRDGVRFERVKTRRAS